MVKMYRKPNLDYNIHLYILNKNHFLKIYNNALHCFVLP